MNKSKVCRLCLSAGQIQIFSKKDLGLEMSERIMKYLHMEVEKDDAWPKLICGECCKALENWHVFFESVHETEIRLYSNFGSRTGDILGKNEIAQASSSEGIEFVSIEMKEENPEQDDSTNARLLQHVILEEGSADDDVIIEEVIEEDDAEDLVKHFDDSQNYEEEIDGEEEDQDDAATAESCPEDRHYEIETRASIKRTSGSRKPKKKTDTVADDELIRRFIPLDCHKCQRREDTFESLMEHIREAHVSEEAFLQCCNRKFRKRNMLLNHARYHENPDIYACDVCHKRFTSKHIRNDHKLQHIPREEQPYQCEICARRFPTLSRLNSHTQSHSDNFCHKCETCGKAFNRKFLLVHHIKVVHNKVILFICEICAKSFRTRDAFQAHQYEHTEAPAPRFKCEECGGQYKTKDTLKKHMQLHTAKNEMVPCDGCDKVFPSKRRMMAHKVFVHTEPKHKCTFCPKEFKHTITWKEHMAAHMRQTLYTCSFCPREFNSNANKYSHQKAQHPVEWETAMRLKRGKV